MIAAARLHLRRALPAPLRIGIAALRRAARDWQSGAAGAMLAPMTRRVDVSAMTPALRIAQPLRRAAHWQGKEQNLRLAAAALDGVLLPPGAILSFWNLIGAATEARGFAPGRAIRGDELRADVGGGLCQISGLLYELGLRAGLTIRERHAHSFDLYDEASRFAPLGLDATIVYAHRDLRLANGCGQALVFGFEVGAQEIFGCVYADAPLAPWRIEIARTDAADGRSRFVQVTRRKGLGPPERVSEDRYLVRTGA